jgi:hypothetical protein
LSILFLSGPCCSADRLMLAREHAGSYAPIDLTDQLDLQQLELSEGCCTLTSDGTAVIVARADRRGFARVALDHDRLGPARPDEFAAIARDIPGVVALRVPVMSHDQCALYFQAQTDHDGDKRPGIYVAERTDPHAPFPPARLLEGMARRYDYVTGVTPDDLTLFVADEYGTRVLVRATTAEPFGVGAPDWIAPMINGWRILPVDGCARLLGTHTPGGCRGEDIAWIRGVDRR